MDANCLLATTLITCMMEHFAQARVDRTKCMNVVIVCASALALLELMSGCQTDHEASMHSAEHRLILDQHAIDRIDKAMNKHH